MNGVDFIANAFGRGIDKLTNIIGKWGSSQPADDSKSGIKIGDEIYQVVVSLNGCYWYLDESGKKQPVSGIPATTEWEWINIAEKVLRDFKTCYRTLGGKVEVWSWFLLNDQLDVLRETHRITDSTDMDNPTGSVLEEIPADWIMIDCDLPDMTERDITPVNRCYKTPGGKVQIEGLESIDDKNTIRESIYTVIQSTDDNFKEGYQMNLIPNDWTRMVCDFPDMTERDVTYTLDCFSTKGGKVQVEGLIAIDNVLGVRESIYTVLQSTDPNVTVGSSYVYIPVEWERMICDFPDMADREVVRIDECYKTFKGKVNVNGYQAIDAVLGVREQYYYIAKTTDPDIEQWSRISRIPNDWVKSECDFPDMSARHMTNVDECYSTPGGKVHLGGYRIFDSVIGMRGQYLIVTETADAGIQRGETMTEIPDSWERVICDFPDATTADTEIVENCYQTGNGKVMMRTYLTFDAEGNTRSQKHVILKTTDSAYSIGNIMSEIPSLWMNIECDFASASQRHIKSLKNCYESESGRIYVEGFAVIDNSLNWDSMTLVVMESTDPAIEVGSAIYSIPEGYKQVACKCNCGN